MAAVEQEGISLVEVPVVDRGADLEAEHPVGAREAVRAVVRVVQAEDPEAGLEPR